MCSYLELNLAKPNQLDVNAPSPSRYMKKYEFRQMFLMKNHADELNSIKKVMDDLNELGDLGWQVTAMSESKKRVMIMLQREKRA